MTSSLAHVVKKIYFRSSPGLRDGRQALYVYYNLFHLIDFNSTRMS